LAPWLGKSGVNKAAAKIEAIMFAQQFTLSDIVALTIISKILAISPAKSLSEK